MNIWKAIWFTVIYSIIFFLLYSFFILPKYFFNIKDVNSFWILSNIITQILTYLLIKKIFIRDYSIIQYDNRLDKKIILSVIILVIAYVIIEQPIIDIQRDLLHKKINIEKGLANEFSIIFILMRYIKGIFIAPIFEELIFRNFLQKKLSKRYSISVSIIFSSFLFAISHVSLNQLTTAFFLGLILGYVFHKTKNIIYPILLHSLSNFFAYTINFYGESLIDWITKNKYNLTYWLIVTLGITFLIIGLKLLNKYTKETNLKLET